MIRKVYEVDPMICPRCGGRMRVVAFLMGLTRKLIQPKMEFFGFLSCSCIYQ